MQYLVMFWHWLAGRYIIGDKIVILLGIRVYKRKIEELVGDRILISLLGPLLSRNPYNRLGEFV